MNYRFLLSSLVLSHSLLAQDVSLALQKKPPLSAAENAAQWQQLKSPVQVGFVNRNVRYSQDRVPESQAQSSQTLTAWKGGRTYTINVALNEVPVFVRKTADH